MMLNPHLRSELPRPHLLKRLHHPEHPVTFLVAPTGYGKTSLLRQYHHEYPGSWYVLINEQDNEPQRLFQRVIQGLPDQTVLPDHDRTPIQLGQILAEALNSSPLTCLIDLDVPITSDVAHLLHALLWHRHDTCRVVIAMHDLSLISLPAGVIENAVNILTSEHLVFTPTEIHQLGLDPQQVSQIGGWPAALHLLSQGKVQDVDQYAAELIDQTALADQLERVSLLPTWEDEDPLAALFGLHGDWASRMLLTGFPMRRVQGSVFEPNPVIRRVLQRRLEADPLCCQDAHSRLATAMETSAPRRALGHHTQAGAMQDRWRVVQQNMRVWARRHEWHLVWEALVPHRMQMRMDDLVIYGTACFETGRLPEALEVLRNVQQSGEAEPAASLALAEALERAGQRDMVVRLLERALKPDLPEEDLANVQIRLAFAHGETGNPTRALELAMSATETANQHGDLTMLVGAVTALGYAYGLLGETEEGLARLQHAAFNLSLVLEPERLLPVSLHLSQLLADAGLPDQADDVLDRVEHALSEAAPWRMTALAVMRAHILIRRGELKSASGLSLQAAEAARPVDHRSLRTRALLQSIWPLVHLGELTRAEHALREARKSALGQAHVSPEIGAFAGLLAAAYGDLQQAMHLFEQARRNLQMGETYLLTALTEAKLLLASGDRVQRMINLIQSSQTQLAPGVLPSLLMHFPEVERSLRLAQVLSQAPIQLQPQIVLELRTLGTCQIKLRVDRHWRTLRFEGSMTRSMLLLLIFEGGKTISELGTVFWSQLESERQQNNVRVTLTKLRKLLREVIPEVAEPLLIDERDRRRFLNPDIQIQHDLATLHQTEIEPEMLVGVYAGPFLPNIDHDWVSALREEIRQQIRQTLERWAVSGGPRLALSCCEALYEVDPDAWPILDLWRDLACAQGDAQDVQRVDRALRQIQA